MTKPVTKPGSKPGPKARLAEYRQLKYMRKTTSLEHHPKIKGYDFERKFDLDAFLDSFSTSAFQASHLAKGIAIVNRMLDDRAGIIISMTANVVSSGMRDIITFLVKNRFVDAIVTTGGGVEEDAIKAMKPFALGDFEVPGSVLFSHGVGRIGNIFVPYDRYLYFERFLNPILDDALRQQKRRRRALAPSEIAHEMGLRIKSRESYLYWAARNNIPVFCPGIVDGGIGDLAYFMKQRHDDFQIDVVADHKRIVDLCMNAKKMGGLILGGGIAKHYTLNANIFREGLDYAVYITVAEEYTGSDSGGNQEEAKTWAKIRCDAETVKIKSEFTIAFPLLVAATFAKRFHGRKIS